MLDARGVGLRELLPTGEEEEPDEHSGDDELEDGIGGAQRVCVAQTERRDQAELVAHVVPLQVVEHRGKREECEEEEEVGAPVHEVHVGIHRLAEGTELVERGIELEGAAVLVRVRLRVRLRVRARVRLRLRVRVRARVRVRV